MVPRLLPVLVLALTLPAPAQIAILQIRVVEGEGTVLAPGSRSPRPLAVEVTDETGRPVAGAAVTFTLPEDGPGGTFANGLRTEVVTTDARGRAGLRSLQVNRTGGRFPVRITASKEQARAGIVAFQFVAEQNAPAAAASKQHRGRWVAVAVALGGAAAGGLALGVAGRSKPGAAPPVLVPSLSPAAVTVPPAPTLGIGPPTITVGRP